MWHVRGLRCKEKEHIQLPDRRRYAKWRNSRRVLTFAQLSVITLSVGESFGFHRSCGGTTMDFASMIPKSRRVPRRSLTPSLRRRRMTSQIAWKWAVTPRFSDANRPSKVSISGPIDVSARPSSTVTLEAEVSDPDHVLRTDCAPDDFSRTRRCTTWTDN